MKVLIDEHILQMVIESIEFHIKPLCLCWAGCPECHPDPAPPSLEEALVMLRGAQITISSQPTTHE